MKTFKIKGVIRVQDDYCDSEQKFALRLAEAMNGLNGIFEGVVKRTKDKNA